MDFVKYHAEATYDRFAPALVKDPGAFLRGGIRLLIDPNPAVHEETFKRFGVTVEYNRETLLRMLEMVRAGQAALTSCAWFFDDFGGLEGRVALRWAARAVELAASIRRASKTNCSSACAGSIRTSAKTATPRLCT